MATSLKFLILICLLYTGIHCGEPDRILFQLQSGNLNLALNQYQQYKNARDGHDLDLLKMMGLQLLEQGYSSNDQEIQMVTLFGAGISNDEKSTHILEEALQGSNPQCQLIALSFLARYQDDKVVPMINRAVTSPFLPIKMEALQHLASKRAPEAHAQIEALMQKVPNELLPFFPKLLAMTGDPESIKDLKRMLSHPSLSVRIEAILACAQFNRDDLLPEIRRLSSHVNIAEQEACSFALGTLRDETSRERLLRLSRSSNDNVKIAALVALYKLGREEARCDLESEALKENIFAINALGQMHGSEATLKKLLKSANNQIRANAAISLLQLRDPAALPQIAELLIKDCRDLALAQTASPGKGLKAWKVIPSARQNLKSDPVSFELSLRLKESLLQQTVELPEQDFLSLAHALFSSYQNELIPLLVHLLENHQTKQSTALLKLHRNQVGAPLIRNYCNLALCRMKEPGPYREELQEWVARYQNHQLIQFRPYFPNQAGPYEHNRYQLTPEDASRLLVEAFESLVQIQDDHAIDTILHAIQHGNAKNRYALAGLLIRAAN